MKYIFLLNSFSLKNKCDIVKKQIDELAKRRNLDYEIRVNSEDISTESILSEYKDDRNIIISLGGDGTLNRVVNGIYGTNNILSLLPLGTGNDFAKSVNEQMKNGINKVDVVKMNDTYFINLVCFGVDADIGNNDSFVHSKYIPKSQRYNAGILQSFIKYHGRHMKVYINDKIYENDYATVAVCNGRYYGRGFKIGTNARIDDGILDVYIVDNMNKLSLVKLMLGMNKGKHETSPKTTHLQTTKLVIESDKEISCNYDGEKMTSKTYDIEILPKSLELYYDEDLQNEFAKIKIKK